MADIEYTQGVDEDYDVPASAGIGRLVNILGAVASVALVAGIGVWGYKLLMRDVSGVPVVRALEGPMRIAPEDPGGRPADHQGLAVNEVAAYGTAAAPAEQVMLAPKPVELAAEDKAMDELEQEKVAGDVSSTVDALVRELMSDSGDVDEEGDTSAVDGPEVLTEAAVQLPATEPEETPAMFRPESGVGRAPGLRESLRPSPRPAGYVASHQPERLVRASASAPVQEIDSATLPAGTRLAQLGAFDTPDIARAEWDQLSQRFADYMGGKARVIQEAESGGRTFYRLRAMGFDDINDARRFCSVLVAESADCIPVTTR
ncbi:SPOR domain-containing protein [Albibacillus kandeliae]|uniref:SPOR domain-containing protein n=1 Tax=Albibacillus kandeliae TaxID=2174228 RepID=UPI000D6896D4|nr:SPOR domain-containing protein [Albibacillus kandeliae]